MFLAAVFGFCLGASIGSFLGVVFVRIPKGMSIVRPASRCLSCNTELRNIDNIPVFSWLILRGRCRTCNATIPPWGWLLEIALGILGALIIIALI